MDVRGARTQEVRPRAVRPPTSMSPDPLILVCDHRGDRTAALVRLFSDEGVRVATTANLRRTLQRIERDQPELIVVRPLVPGGRVELEAIDGARAGDAPIPMLVVADRADPGPALEATACLTTSAWDLVYDDAPRAEIEVRLAKLDHAVRALQEMRELRHRALHDDRTDLLRPGTFEARLREHFSAAQRHKIELAFVLIDLDKFGQINKRFDHTVGDALIERVGHAIRFALRAEDVAGRLGGDEFGVVLPYTKKVDAARVVNRLLDEIRSRSGRPAGALEQIDVSASIGFETFDGNDLVDYETLRLHAERAMRAAKVAGGDRALYYRNLRPEADSA